MVLVLFAPQQATKFWLIPFGSKVNFKLLTSLIYSTLSSPVLPSHKLVGRLKDLCPGRTRCWLYLLQAFYRARAFGLEPKLVPPHLFIGTQISFKSFVSCRKKRNGGSCNNPETQLTEKEVNFLSSEAFFAPFHFAPPLSRLLFRQMARVVPSFGLWFGKKQQPQLPLSLSFF